ncbi:hypothetical protein ABT324_28055 [Saccharopolyspora sp. NPDC000359]|uniref:hypothetical protein n=1 Tax=Saccharopolyspora sp. NPDC000359 TaxID=3154251 RepID=UPI00332307A2
MTMSNSQAAAAAATAPDPEDQQAVPERPELRLISGVDDLEVPEGTEAQPPLPYRIHAGLAEALTKLPGMWSQRQPALAEIVEYSLHGDWTANSKWRSAHLLGVILLCLPAGLLAVALIHLSRKPSRVLIALAVLLILGYAL